jgi:hypothetical protein
MSARLLTAIKSIAVPREYAVSEFSSFQANLETVASSGEHIYVT